MPVYSEADLIRARRPLADPLERGEAFCTLGHLEAEQRTSPTADRAGIISEITANIAAFDGGGTVARASTAAPVIGTTAAPIAPPPPVAPSPQPSSTSPNLLVDSMRARHPNAVAVDHRPQRVDLLGASSHDRMQAGMAASRASMERTLRRQGLWSDVRQRTTANGASASLDRELRQAGLLPPARG